MFQVKMLTKTFFQSVKLAKALEQVELVSRYLLYVVVSLTNVKTLAHICECIVCSGPKITILKLLKNNDIFHTKYKYKSIVCLFIQRAVDM